MTHYLKITVENKNLKNRAFFLKIKINREIIVLPNFSLLRFSYVLPFLFQFSPRAPIFFIFIVLFFASRECQSQTDTDYRGLMPQGISLYCVILALHI
jgi:hypothetical protein